MIIDFTPQEGEKMTKGEKLYIARQDKGYTRTEVAKLTGINDKLLFKYEKDIITNIPLDNLEELCKLYNISPAYVVGWEDAPESKIPNYPNIFPIERKKVPLLGKIACGKPILSEEIFDGYVQCNGNVHADFCLRAEGDSMIGARIYDGDIVFIKQQPDVENGEIAAVSIDDAVTLKRVYFGDDYVELKPENPTHKILRFSKTEIEQFRIIGKAIAFQGDVI